MISAKVERAGCPLTVTVLLFTKTILSMATNLERQASKNMVELKQYKTDETLLGAFVERMRRM